MALTTALAPNAHARHERAAPPGCVHRVDPHGALDRKLVTIFIAREVIDDVIARGVAILNRRHHSAGN